MGSTHTTPSRDENCDGVVFTFQVENLANTYKKSHLSFEGQLERLEGHGLTVPDSQRGIEVLMRVGYYRLSAYWYPFRELKPEGQKTTEWNYRFDHFTPGHSLEEAIALYEFDAKLRALTFEALQTIEVALRAAIAYFAGKENKYIHLNRNMLDRKACSHVPKNSKVDSYTIWKKKYQKQYDRAKGEDYIRHHIARYGDKIPIWIATEFLDFGSISMLFNYLPKEIKNDIAPHFGVLQGTALASWVRNLNYVRNIIAHHSRLWNRFIVTKSQQPNRAIIDPGLFHLTDPGAKDRFMKLYPTLAIIAYTLSFIEPESDWRIRLASLMSNFPETGDLSPVKVMGFPHNWQSLGIWKPDLVFTNGATIPPWFESSLKQSE